MPIGAQNWGMKMTDKRPLDDTELDGLFTAAQDAAPVPSDDLMARILADAEAEIAVAPAPVPMPRRGILRMALGVIGGWPAAAGLAAAAVTGVMIGLASPDALESLSGGALSADGGYALDDLVPSYGDLLGEG